MTSDAVTVVPWRLIWATVGPDPESRARAERLEVALRLPVLMASDGSLDYSMNQYFCSPQFQSFSTSTQETYAQEIAVWCSYLDRFGLSWIDAVEDDFLAFKVARTGPAARPTPVAGATWNKAVAALTALYVWAVKKRTVSQSPVPVEASARRPGRGARATNARKVRPDRWVTPSTYRLWRDVGLLGRCAEVAGPQHYEAGSGDPSFGGRLSQRNATFSNLAYITGLRVRECGSLLTVDVPAEEAERALAAAVAKFGSGRMFMWPSGAVEEVRQYMRFTRQTAVSRARRAGRYDGIEDILWVSDSCRTRKGLALIVAGEAEPLLLNGIDAAKRLRLFTDTPRGPEPMSLWLNENGMPMPHAGWDAVFMRANQRVERELRRLGYSGDRLWVMPHSLRFSFALALLATLHQQIDEAHPSGSDFGYDEERYRFAFEQVRSRLGHSSIETTKGIYLRPVQTIRGHALLRAASKGFGIEAALSDLAASVYDENGSGAVRDLANPRLGRPIDPVSLIADTLSDDN